MSWSRKIVLGLLVTAAASLSQSCGKAVVTDCTCNSATTILVSATTGNLPDTCASKSAGTTLTWQATGTSLTSIKMPDWGTQQPTTPVNPYPGANCPSTTSCTSGAFAGAAAPDCTAIPYSITTTNGSTSKKHFGRIIIKR